MAELTHDTLDLVMESALGELIDKADDPHCDLSGHLRISLRETASALDNPRQNHELPELPQHCFLPFSEQQSP
jgi:hypothetical protein